MSKAKELINYFNTQFETDFTSVDTKPMSKLSVEVNPELKGLSWFGGIHWMHFGRDTCGLNKKEQKHIPEEDFNATSLVSCLYVHILVQEALDHYFHSKFKNYKFKDFPRFGYEMVNCFTSERLQYMLDIPQQNGIELNLTAIKGLLDYFINEYVCPLGISYKKFINKIKDDTHIFYYKYHQWWGYKYPVGCNSRKMRLKIKEMAKKLEKQ